VNGFDADVYVWVQETIGPDWLHPDAIAAPARPGSSPDAASIAITTSDGCKRANNWTSPTTAHLSGWNPPNGPGASTPDRRRGTFRRRAVLVKLFT
jgi:hypothetical protein